MCFGIFLKNSDWPFWIILSESFEKRACILTAGKHIRAKYSLWSILLWSWNLYSVMMKKKCKTRKSGQKTQTRQNICRQSISFCCFHCWYLYYRGIQSLHLLLWVLCSTTNDSMEKQSSKGKLCSIHPHQLTANCAISLLRFFNSLIACSQLLSYIPHLPHGGAVSGSAFPCWMHTRPVHQCETDSNTNVPERGTSYWPSQSGLPDVWLLRGGSPRYDKNSLAKWGHGWSWSFHCGTVHAL